MEAHWRLATTAAHVALGLAVIRHDAAVTKLNRCVSIHEDAVAAERRADSAYNFCIASQYIDDKGKRQGRTATGRDRRGTGHFTM